MVLAMGLPGLELFHGQPFSLGQGQPEASSGISTLLGGGDFVVWILRGVIAMMIIILPFYIIFSLLTPKGRRRLIADLVLLALLFLVSEFLRKLPRKENTDLQNRISGVPQNLEKLLNSNPTTSFSAAPPQWLTLVVIVVVSLIMGVFVIGSIWFFQRRSRSQKTSLAKLAKEAQKAIDSLQTGSDFSLTIVRCYQEMMRVVKEEKGIARRTSMTPREFEDHLVREGFPQKPIVTLTRLFEQVRYGSIPVGTQEEKMALLCLTDIVNACQSIGESHAIQ